MNHHESIAPAALTTDDAARYIGQGRTTLYRLIKEGRLRSKKIGRKRIILRDDLDKYLSELEDA